MQVIKKTVENHTIEVTRVSRRCLAMAMIALHSGLRSAEMQDRYGKNVFMQKQLPPAFSNSEVSTSTGVNPS